MTVQQGPPEWFNEIPLHGEELPHKGNGAAGPDLRGRLPLIYYDDIHPSTQTNDFVENLLISTSFVIIYGESNSGKTFFTLDLALHIATGRSWRGLEVTQGGVVYCALEGSAAFANRVEAWRREIGSDTPASFAAITSAINLLSPDADVHDLIAAIKEAGAKMAMPVTTVILDTLSRALAGGNENAPDDMGAFVANVDAIRQATGATVIVVHHSGKDTAKGARGHSLLRAAADTEIEILVDGDHLARVSKQRELEGGQEYRFSLKKVEIGTNSRGKPVTSCVVDDYTDNRTSTGQLPDKDSGNARKIKRLSGRPKTAYELLSDVIATSGLTGFVGTPQGVASVPDDWWRERFYNSTMPGDTLETKQKAFKRAAQALMEERIVAMAKNRVWIVHSVRENRESQE